MRTLKDCTSALLKYFVLILQVYTLRTIYKTKVNQLLYFSRNGHKGDSTRTVCSNDLDQGSIDNTLSRLLK